MARDLSTICYISKLLTDSEPWTLDPKCVPLPWNEPKFQEIQSRPLVIGVIRDDGVVKVHPPIERALKELVEKLKVSGHEVIEWDTSDHGTCIEIMDLYYTADGGEDIRRDILAYGEPFVPHVEALVNRGKPISVYEYWQLNKRRNEAQKRYLDKWKATRSPLGRAVDVLLSPTMSHTSIPHRTCRWVGYTKIWNLLDYPAISFPVDHVRLDKDSVETFDYTPRNEIDAWHWKSYDVAKMAGHPVSLQVIGRRLEEETVLGAMVAIERIFGKKQSYHS
jgi:amidase